MITPFHAKYFAYELSCQHAANSGVERLSQSLFNASVDLNPHQIEAALFAMQSPLSQGVLLADEVGLGKTIEAGIVLCQYWSERKRHLLVICPASLRKQWALELQQKFSLPAIVLDQKTSKDFIKKGISPLQQKSIVIVSYNYACRIKDDIKKIPWHLVVIDEAHKLRNAYRESNKVGQTIKWATSDCRKLLLTATPLQNSLLELYGLSTLIDEHLFGDINAFRSQYVNAGGNLAALRERLSTFCRRTLRQDVMEYIRYTQRKAMTRPFHPTDDEHQLYEAVSNFLLNQHSYAIPKQHRHLTELILRKLLASSSMAIAGTLGTMRQRLENLRDEKIASDDNFAEQLIFSEELEDELLDEILDEQEDEIDDLENEQNFIDYKKLAHEIDELAHLENWAKRIGTDTKSHSLLQALDIGFEQMANTGAQRKALIFTESKRTQDYLYQFLQKSGYANQVVCFSGTNNSAQATLIYQAWLEKNQQSGRITGSRDIDIRTALIEYFRDEATILIATEAAAEGVNIQFCSLVINYDLPWNPQRVEQRIGRCHRYGQEHDVVVINFLNERNQADKRVLELLTEKFKLFDGVFGASDEIIGRIEAGLDFEKRVLAIYQTCRQPHEIEAAFKQLQADMENSIQQRMHQTHQALLENFDEDVHQRLKLRLADAKTQLDRVGQRFWRLSQFVLKDVAKFNEQQLSFELLDCVDNESTQGHYYLISKNSPQAASNHQVQEPKADYEHGRFLYRLSHPLGEYVLEQAKKLQPQPQTVIFDISHHPTKLSVVEQLTGQTGCLILQQLAIDSYEHEEYLLFSGFTEQGLAIEQETFEKLFNCQATLTANNESFSDLMLEKLHAEAQRHVQATISHSLETNNSYFNQAREKLEKWADDKVLAAESALKDTKEQIKIAQRQARQATSVDEQHELEQKIQKLQKLQRKQRQEIFSVEDEIIEQRDGLISTLERRLTQKTQVQTLFVLQWQVV